MSASTLTIIQAILRKSPYTPDPLPPNRGIGRGGLNEGGGLMPLTTEAKCDPSFHLILKLGKLNQLNFSYLGYDFLNLANLVILIFISLNCCPCMSDSVRLHTTPHTYTLSWKKVRCFASPLSCEDEYLFGLGYKPSDNTK